MVKIITKSYHIVVDSDVKSSLDRAKILQKESYSLVIKRLLQKTGNYDSKEFQLPKEKKRDPKEWKVIPVRQKTIDDLKNLKIVPREAHNTVVQKLIKSYKEKK